MRTKLLVGWGVGWAVAALIGACGSGVEVGGSGGSTGTGGGATSSGSGATSAAGAGGAASGSSSASAGGGKDASADGDAGIVTGMFDCNGCLCAGATHYCLIIHGGAKPGPPPEPMCPEEAGTTGCVPLPAACASMPSCSCLEAQMGGCECVEMGGGVTVTCVVP